MKNNNFKLNKMSIFLGFYSKLLIFFIIFYELLLLFVLPTFLANQKFAELDYQKQKTAVVIQNFQQKINKKLKKESKKKIEYPLIVEINDRLEKLSWVLKNEKHDFTLTYYQDIQKSINDYEESLKKIDKLLNIELEDINHNHLIKSVL